MKNGTQYWFTAWLALLTQNLYSTNVIFLSKVGDVYVMCGLKTKNFAMLANITSICWSMCNPLSALWNSFESFNCNLQGKEVKILHFYLMCNHSQDIVSWKDHYKIGIISSLSVVFYQNHILQVPLHSLLDLSIQIYQQQSTKKKVCWAPQ